MIKFSKSIVSFKKLSEKDLLAICCGHSSDVGPNIKRIRVSKGLKRNTLADMLHISLSTLSRYEEGSRIPNLDTLIDLADIFEADIKEIVYKN